jgi:hypothetical protein
MTNWRHLDVTERDVLAGEGDRKEDQERLWGLSNLQELIR